jgi:hypothetical protein
MIAPTPADNLAAVSVPPIPLSRLPQSGPLRILILPDLHVPLGPRQMELLLGNRAFLEAHDWVILLGDVTACYGTLGEYRQVSRFIEQLGRPYSVVNGNHEFFFLPPEDGSPEYGRLWQPASPEIQRQQLARFAQFYGRKDSFQVKRHALAGLCLVGVDRIAQDDGAHLSEDHEAWLAQNLSELRDTPLLVFGHFPLRDRRLENLRYYEPGRRPYYSPSVATAQALHNRAQPAFWFSGHVHFRPSHPLAQPYLTQDGVWQVHCPDGWGYGRADNRKWHPERYDGLFVRSVHLEDQSLRLITTDLQHNTEIARHDFDLASRQLIAAGER